MNNQEQTAVNRSLSIEVLPPSHSLQSAVLPQITFLQAVMLREIQRIPMTLARIQFQLKHLL